MKSPKPSYKAHRKVDYKNYDAITMRRNYDTKLLASKLWGEIMTENIQLVYQWCRNVGIIGILAYPKKGIKNIEDRPNTDGKQK